MVKPPEVLGILPQDPRFSRPVSYYQYEESFKVVTLVLRRLLTIDARTVTRIERRLLPFFPNFWTVCRLKSCEILREIFIWYSYTGGGNAAVLGRLERCTRRGLPQLAISHVCSNWRAIALSTPQLWNNIVFEYLDPIAIQQAKRWLSQVGKRT